MSGWPVGVTFLTQYEAHAPSPSPATDSAPRVSSEEAAGIGLQLLFCEESQEAMRGPRGVGRCCVNRAAELDWAASFSFSSLVTPPAGRVARRGGPGACLR